ncbi:hypothetical protein V2J09_019908 [Rumex salicifolius]
MGRRPCCEKVGLNRGPWTVEEDLKLTIFILNHGIHCWRIIPKLAGVRRCGKSCRLRWVNYLRPDLKRGAMSEAEEDEIIQLHSRYGNRWSKIAAHFPGRTDNEIKNHWNTRIKKKLKDQQQDNMIKRPPLILQPSTSGSLFTHTNDNRATTTTRTSIADESKELQDEETTTEAACSNLQSTSSSSQTYNFWQIFEMELTCSSSTTCQRNVGAVQIQEQDIQNWIGCLQSLLFSDGLHSQNL